MENKLNYILSVLIANIIVFPIDTIKIRLQNKLQLFNDKFLFGLYQGYPLQCMVSVPYTTAKLSLYKYLGSNNVSINERCFITTCSESLIGLPINNVIIQIQSNKKKFSLNLIKKHLNYKGLPFQFIRDLSFNLLFFNLYEKSKLNKYSSFYSSLIASSIATTVVTPIDFMKTNNQLGAFKFRESYNFLKNNYKRSMNSVGHRILIRGLFYSITMYLSDF